MQRKGFNKTTYIILLCFIFPVIIMSSVLIFKGIYPFGDKTIITTDLYHQYEPFIAELRRKLLSGSSFFYTSNVGFGADFISLYAYYLSSPLNLLSIFVKEEHLPEFIAVLIVFKTGLCGSSMGYYLQKHSTKNEYIIILFSIFYALSGYISAYYWNIMWLDVIALFPILVYHFESFFETGKGTGYCLLLAACIWLNFYISIAICIFLCIYFIILCISDPIPDINKIKKRSVSFILYSLVSAGLCAVILLPTIASLMNSSSGNMIVPTKVTEYFPILDVLKKHIPGLKTDIITDKWPNIYCGAAVFLFLPMYFLNRNIGIKEKAISFGLIMLFFLSFSVNVLDYVWHGLHFPNSLPARQSFIYVFLIIYICFKCYKNRRYTTRKDIIISYAISVFMIFLLQSLSVSEDSTDGITFIIAFFIISAYAAVFYALKTNAISKVLAICFVVCIVFGELFLNTYTWIDLSSRTEYMTNEEDIKNLINSEITDAKYYRINHGSGLHSKNEGSLYGYGSSESFSSIQNNKIVEFLKNMGCNSSPNICSMYGATPLVKMLTGIKYEILDNNDVRKREDQPAVKKGNVSLYENKHTLPIGYLIKQGSVPDMTYTDPVAIQNAFSKAYCKKDILIKEYLNSNDNMEYKITSPGEYYAVVKTEDIKPHTLNITINKDSYEETINNKKSFIELGYLKEGVNVSLEKDGKSCKAEFYRINDDALKKMYQELSCNVLNIDVLEDGYIKGNITVPDNEKYDLCITIPYSKGWKLKIDGNQVGTDTSFEAFISAEIDPGEHMVEMTYIPEMFNIGIIISITSVGIFFFLNRKNIRFFIKKTT